MPATPLPTQSELAILDVLWTKGPSTVRDIFVEFSSLKPTGYTTVLKLLQIMFEKGLVERDDSQRSHVYRAAVKQGLTQKRLVQGLLDRAFAGSAAKLVLQALSSGKVSQAELSQIRALIEQMRKD